MYSEKSQPEVKRIIPETDADREIPALASSDNAGNLVIPRFGISRYASEIDDILYSYYVIDVGYVKMDRQFRNGS